MLLLGLLRFCGRRDRGRLRDGRASAAAFKRSASASDTNANPFPINAGALPHDELMTSSPRFDICQCGRASRDRGFEHFDDGLESNDSARQVLGGDTLRMIARVGYRRCAGTSSSPGASARTSRAQVRGTGQADLGEVRLTARRSRRRLRRRCWSKRHCSPTPALRPRGLDRASSSLGVSLGVEGLRFDIDAVPNAGGTLETHGAEAQRHRPASSHVRLMFACGIATVAPVKPVKLISWNTNARRHVQRQARGFKVMPKV